MSRTPSNSSRALGAALLAFAVTAPAQAADASFRDRLLAGAREFRGTLGLSARNLDTGEEVGIRADERFPTASLIKLAVMVETYHRIAERTLARDTVRRLDERDKVGDEPVVLNSLHAGLPLTVSDLVSLMIAFSDNTATNMLIGLVGTANVDHRMDSYGLPNTRLFRPTFRDGHADVLPELEKEFGLGMTTPREAARLMQAIAEGKVVSRAVSDEMLSILERQQDRAMIPRSLPFERDRIVVANKTGWDEEKLADSSGFRGEIRTDAAYVRAPHARWVIAILTRRGADKRPTADNDALVIGARLSRIVYDRFNGSPSRNAPRSTPPSLPPRS